MKVKSNFRRMPTEYFVNNSPKGDMRYENCDERKTGSIMENVYVYWLMYLKGL
jgi:hypothetical protein